MSKDNSYACTGCGLCCTTVGKTIENVKDLDSSIPFNKAFQDFPYKAKEDGSCEKLDEDGKCMVYEDRPLVCRIPKMFEKFHSKKMTRRQYYLSEAKLCNRKIKQSELSDEFLVDESLYRSR